MPSRSSRPASRTSCSEPTGCASRTAMRLPPRLNDGVHFIDAHRMERVRPSSRPTASVGDDGARGPLRRDDARGRAGRRTREGVLDVAVSTRPGGFSTRTTRRSAPLIAVYVAKTLLEFFPSSAGDRTRSQRPPTDPRTWPQLPRDAERLVGRDPLQIPLLQHRQQEDEAHSRTEAAKNAPLKPETSASPSWIGFGASRTAESSSFVRFTAIVDSTARPMHADLLRRVEEARREPGHVRLQARRGEKRHGTNVSPIPIESGIIIGSTSAR